MPLPEAFAQSLKVLEESGIGKGPFDAKGRTRARILRAALELFQRLGYRRTTVDEIAQAAGVAKGTVYVHFKNKAELFFHVIAEEKKKFIGRFLPILRAELPPQERFRRYLETGLRIIPEVPLVAKVLSGDRELLAFYDELDPELSEQLHRVKFAGWSALLAGIGAWDKLDQRQRDERVVVLQGLVFAVGYLMDPRMRGGLSAERYTELLARMIAHGAGAP
ncbi:MAG: TetR/AcrR family transcriptional regulator [Myxococcales bacterium]|nr:TetR/AcrR family transcriptional regulator [Myxococcales bacterium]